MICLKEVKDLSDFNIIAKERGYSEDYYPYATKGVNMIWKIKRNIIRFVTYAITGAMFYTAYFWLSKLVKPKGIVATPIKVVDDTSYQADNIGQKYLMKIITGDFSDTLNKYVSTANFVAILKYIAYVLLIVSAIYLSLALLRFIIYNVLVVKRWQNYERNVYTNDLKAVSLKSKTIKALHLKKRITELRKKSKGNKTMSLADRTTLHELKTLERMNVYINTRQALDSAVLMQVARVVIDIPTSQEEADKIEKDVKKLDSLTRRLSNGEYAFGEFMVSSNQLYWISKAVEEVPDKYDYSDIINSNKEEVKVEMDFTFSLDSFTSNIAEIEANKEGAEMWASRTGKALTSFFTSSKASVKLVRYEFGATTASFIFDVGDSFDISNITRLTDSLDTIFKTHGSSITLNHEGQMVTLLPMPDKFKSPIDVKSMYLEVFG